MFTIKRLHKRYVRTLNPKWFRFNVERKTVYLCVRIVFCVFSWTSCERGSNTCPCFESSSDSEPYRRALTVNTISVSEVNFDRSEGETEGARGRSAVEREGWRWDVTCCSLPLLSFHSSETSFCFFFSQMLTEQHLTYSYQHTTEH